jgi:DNA-binding response OmpR family regulator
MQPILVTANYWKLSNLLEQELQRQGWATSIATSKIEVLQRVAVSSISLLILDLDLFGEQSAGILRAIRQRNHHLPILMITSLRERSDRANCVLKGAEKTLLKPFYLREVSKQIATSFVIPGSCNAPR